MRLRDLKLKDAPLMLEWMHDENVVENLRLGFANKTLEDCEAFIKAAENKEHDIHLAIVSDEDEYMGTVSLKFINWENKTAEAAITIRRSAMGCGYSSWAIQEIIRLAFEEYGLEGLYGCISRNNKRALRFYEKLNYHEVTGVPDEMLKRYEGMDNLVWYGRTKGDMKP